MIAQSTHPSIGAPKSGAVIQIFSKNTGSPADPPLSEEETVELNQCEKVIDVDAKAFFRVGAALATIRSKKLYRKDFATFDEYCRKRWDFGRLYAYRFLKAAEIKARLFPIGNFPLPENECQIRALGYLPEHLTRKAWEKAVKRAEGGKVTGKLVTEVVNEYLPKKAKTRKKTRLSWQYNVAPLLKSALRAVESGDHETVARMIRRIALLLEVGNSNVSLKHMEGEQPVHD